MGVKVGCGFRVFGGFGLGVREGLGGWVRFWEGRGGVKVGG